MVKAARATNRIVQVGTHRRTSPHLIKARELIRSGKVGKVGMIRCHLNAGGTGITRADMFYVLLFGELWFQVPHSIKVVAPLAIMARTVSAQRTGLKSCSLSARRMPSSLSCVRTPTV